MLCKFAWFRSYKKNLVFSVFLLLFALCLIFLLWHLPERTIDLILSKLLSCKSLNVWKWKGRAEKRDENVLSRQLRKLESIFPVDVEWCLLRPWKQSLGYLLLTDGVIGRVPRELSFPLLYQHLTFASHPTWKTVRQESCLSVCGGMEATIRRQCVACW